MNTMPQWAEELLETVDLEEVVEYLDAEWPRHFLTVEQAFEHYSKFDAEGFAEALRYVAGPTYIPPETEYEDPEADPTPWCSACGAKRKADCACGPLADND